MKTTELENLKQTTVLLQTTGAEAVIQSLKAEGVKTIFCSAFKDNSPMFFKVNFRLTSRMLFHITTSLSIEATAFS